MASTSIDRTAIREFYLSNSSNFGAFKSAHDRRASPSPSPTKKVLGSGTAIDGFGAASPDARRSLEDQLLLQQQLEHQQRLSPGVTSKPRAVTDPGFPRQLATAAGDAAEAPLLSTPPRVSREVSQQRHRLEPIAVGGAVAAASNSLRTPPKRESGGAIQSAASPIKTATPTRAVAPVSSSSTPSPGNRLVPIGASDKYMGFLRDQQSVHRSNTHIVESIGAFIAQRREAQAAILKAVAGVVDLLHSVEAGGSWGLVSKYDVAQLVRDAQLSLQPCELTKEQPAVTDALANVSAALCSLESRFAPQRPNVAEASSSSDPSTFAAHRMFIEQGQRRLHLLQRTITDNSNLDVTHLAASADPLLVALEESLQQPALESLLRPAEEKLEYCAFRTDELRRQREHAIAEGEVNVAEKCTYDLLDVNEEALQVVIDKFGGLDAMLQQHTVRMGVTEKYAATVDFSAVRARANGMRTRCQHDLAKMFALREKVEEVEAQTAQKVANDIAESDKLLRANTERISDVFLRIEALERELEVLQRERHREVLRRFAEKDKDEHRRVEFARFCDVVQEHMVPLERTIRNMDTLLHAANVVEEFLGAGFRSLREWGAARLEEIGAVKLEAHKQHVEVLRELVGSVADMAFRKERMIEATDRGIQRAHVEQELLAETFNPNAHRFADIKKRLMQSRAELEDDVAELKRRAGAAVDAFAPSERELERKGVPFIHPVTEQEHRVLALRARAIEVRAAAVGFGDGGPLLDEIRALQLEVAEVQGDVERVNAETTGTLGRTLPLLESMKKARSPPL